MSFTLKQARLFSGFSQAEIATLLGVHRQTYMKWEKNADEMPLGKAREFSRITQVSIDNIFFNYDSTLSR